MIKYFALLEDEVITGFDIIMRESNHAIIRIDNDSLRTQDIDKYSPVEISEDLLIGLESVKTHFPFHKIYLNPESTFEEEATEKVKTVVYFTDEEIQAGLKLFKLMVKNYIDNMFNTRYIANTPKLIDKASWDKQKQEIYLFENFEGAPTPFVDELSVIAGCTREEYFTKIKSKISEHDEFLLDLLKSRKKVTVDLSNIETKLDQSLFLTKWFGYEPNYKLFRVLDYTFDESTRNDGNIQF